MNIQILFVAGKLCLIKNDDTLLIIGQLHHVKTFVIQTHNYSSSFR